MTRALGAALVAETRGGLVFPTRRGCGLEAEGAGNMVPRSLLASASHLCPGLLGAQTAGW